MIFRTRRREAEIEELRRRLETIERRERERAEAAARALRCAAAALAPSAGGLAARLADLARALGPPEGLDLREIPVAGPLAEVIEEYRGRVGEEREIVYMEDGGGGWLHARIDRALFARAMRELLDNCLRHAGDWGRITVTSEPVEGAVIVRVRDDGAGLPSRAAPPAAGSAGESGLGLLLVRSVLAAHGGTIELAGEPGRGTRVSTRWPAPPAGGAGRGR